jgi:hypothetical protein
MYTTTIKKMQDIEVSEQEIKEYLETILKAKKKNL